MTNKRTVLRRIASISAREKHLSKRFLDPVIDVGWNSDAFDMTASYVALAHAECEEVLEKTVTALVHHCVTSSNHGHRHPAAVNLTLHLSSKLNSAVGLRYAATRRVLESDSNELSANMAQLRVAEYWKNSIDGNHGAGSRYIEKMMQPLGVKIDERSFRQLEGIGVRALFELPSTFQTDLNEITTLRGRAVHTSRSTFAQSVRGSSPSDIRLNALRGMHAIETLCVTVVNRIW